MRVPGLFRALLLASAAFTSAVASGIAAAESASEFPSRPLRIIVPFTAGSGSDSSARYYGEALGRALGQPVVVENRPGANGVIGIQALRTRRPTATRSCWRAIRRCRSIPSC